jgi:hypothetical protein
MTFGYSRTTTLSEYCRFNDRSRECKNPQENVMKTTAVVVMMMLAATAKAQFAPERAYFAKASYSQSINTARTEQSYLSCLRTGNDGVIESALAHVAMMKLTVPWNESKATMEKVGDVARTATSPEIRYKAFLTKAVLEDPRMFLGIASSGCNTPDELFSLLASRLISQYAAR